MQTQEIAKNGKNERGLERTRARNELAPAVDVYENEAELLLVADVPGVTPERLNLHIDPPELRIEASTADEGGITWVRAFNIDERIAAGQVSAELKNGVLTVHLPKAPEAKPRRVEVKAS
ncbi:MAG TPA: Hsp20/alpha crystallin family protein [Polyangiaceae bacterium]